ncbi:MAG TPA: alpha-amylase [Ignavibacteriales bacterium]|nr:glycoside hydrolase family 57 protein [Candidatus Woesearchaeota archaeon]HAB52600.1 alpha-amylase [Ignavibacteriales bacterium]
MVSVCFYFQVHQPHRLRNYSVFDISKNHNYFDEKVNEEIIKKVASKCYLPANRLMLELINNHKGKFKISYSITGTALEQFEAHTPKVIESFKALADTGCVEFLNETYYHSLSFLKSKKEFLHQINLHKRKMKSLFNVRPKVFRNTELVFNNELATFIENQGYKGILAEGAEHILGWKSPNFIYMAKTASAKQEVAKIKLLVKNYRLSDDIAFRFSNRQWNEWPLTPTKFADWINQVNGNGDVVNLFMDYETFGEHQWEETGIFDFMRTLPKEILKQKDNEFLTPSDIIKKHDAKDELDFHNFVSWADVERDLSAWLGNDMQKSAFDLLFELEKGVLRTNNLQLIKDWRKLQTSDHFYYMCTKWFGDGDVHKYFNPYESPYDCYIAFMNIINDLRYRVKETL